MSGCEHKPVSVNPVSSVPNHRTAPGRETNHRNNVHLKLLEKLTAKPQNVFDLFDPQKREILGECQRHVPHLWEGGCTREQRSVSVTRKL